MWPLRKETTMTKPKSKSASNTAAKLIAAATKPARRRVARRSASTPPAAPVPVIKTTKRDQLAALLVRDEGATLDQMIAATGWLPHTTRAALTGLKKRGYAIDSDKIDGVRTYCAVAPK
jgi:hypothetical protein